VDRKLTIETSKYQTAWTRYSRRKRYLYLAAIPFAVGLYFTFDFIRYLGFFSVEQYKALHFFLGVTPWIILYLFIVSKVSNFTCPRCGQSFFGRFFRKNIRPIKNCVHCGLSISEMKQNQVAVESEMTDTSIYHFAWKRFTRRRTYLYLAAIPFCMGLLVTSIILGCGCSALAKRHEVSLFLAGTVPWVVVYFFIASKALRFICPRCGQSFFGKFFRRNIWPIKKCVHCGLSISEMKQKRIIDEG
jgi:uncharacterized protein (DUF983 family)